jgi:trk system potassium uptake protein TrkA
MKIVIAGAGDVGFNLAQLLSLENQDITLIDENEDVLNHASSHLDVMIVKGDVSSLSVLNQCDMKRANLFIAVTTSETTNLFSCILAKKLGATRTIARVNNPEFLETAQIESFEELGVDTLISPQQLAAEEIDRLLSLSAFSHIAEFEGGRLAVVGFSINNESGLRNLPLQNLRKKINNAEFKTLAVVRERELMMPNEEEILKGGDHVYLSVRDEYLGRINDVLDKERRKVRRVMVVGGTSLAMKTAQLLENKYKVSIIAQGKEVCKKFLECLSKSIVIDADPGNVEVLKEEGISKMDAFVALTDNSETNILGSLMAEQLGVYKTIAHVDNAIYTQISHRIGVDTLINKKIIAANNIFRFVRKGHVEALTSLHDTEVEIIEYVIHKENRTTRKALAELFLPSEAVIAGIIREKETILPTEEFICQLGDRVIVLAGARAIAKVEEIFK